MLNNYIFFSYFSNYIEFYLGTSILNVLIVILLLKNNIFKLSIHNSISECCSLIFFLSLILIYNDNYMKYYFILFNNALIMDMFTYISNFFICFICGIYFCIISNFLNQDKFNIEFIIILKISILGLFLMCSSNDFLLIFLAIETVSLTSYFLTAIIKKSKFSVENGIKYLVIGTISSSFFLFGVSYFYFITGSNLLSDFNLCFFDWSNDLIYYKNNCFFVSNNLLQNEIFIINYYSYILNLTEYITFLYYNFFFNKSNIIEISFFFILFSIFIKLALVPFHIWSLDVYEASPLIILFYFLTITKISFFVLLLRICNVLLQVYFEFIIYFIILLGVLNIIVGSFGNLSQKKLKTILVYSSLNHMGFLLLSISLCSFYGIESFLFYIFIYLISNIIIWSILIMLKKKNDQYINKKSFDISEILMLGKTNKIFCYFLIVILFSMAGFPPIVGFLAKLNVIFSLIQNNYILILMVIAISTILATFYYLRIIKIILFENKLVGKLFFSVTNNKVIIICFLVFCLIILFIKPFILYLIIHKFCFFINLDNFYNTKQFIFFNL